MSSDADKQQRMSDGGLGGARPPGEQRRLDSELGRFEPVSDAYVLAAIERAERHREREHEGVMLSDIAEHLGLFMARGLRAGCVRSSTRSLPRARWRGRAVTGWWCGR
jgi:hypothetical protein